MSYSDDVFRKDIIKELNRIATALENIDMKMKGKNSLNPEEVVVYADDKPLKTRTLTDCQGCENLFITYDVLSNEQLYRCVHYGKLINEISNCNLR